jgi:hypothetical protein
MQAQPVSTANGQDTATGQLNRMSSNGHDHRSEDRSDRGKDGRFVAQNQAARKAGGWRATSKAELRRRSRRVSRLLGQYLRLRATEGRALGPSQSGLARRLCELHVLAGDLWLICEQNEGNGHARKDYLAATRAYVLAASALGETMGAMRGIRPEPEGLVYELARARGELEAHKGEAEAEE